MFYTKYKKSYIIDRSSEVLQQCLDDINRNYTMVIPVVLNKIHYDHVEVMLKWNLGDKFPVVSVSSHSTSSTNHNEIELYVKLNVGDNTIAIGNRTLCRNDSRVTVLVGIDHLSIDDIANDTIDYYVNRHLSVGILKDEVTLLDAIRTTSIPIFPETWRIVPGDMSLCTFLLCTNKSLVCGTNFNVYTIDDFQDLDIVAGITGIPETKYIVVPTRGYLGTIRGMVINPIGNKDDGYVPLYLTGIDSDPDKRVIPFSLGFSKTDEPEEI